MKDHLPQNFLSQRVIREFFDTIVQPVIYTASYLRYSRREARVENLLGHRHHHDFVRDLHRLYIESPPPPRRCHRKETIFGRIFVLAVHTNYARSLADTEGFKNISLPLLLPRFNFFFSFRFPSPFSALIGPPIWNCYRAVWHCKVPDFFFRGWCEILLSP